MAGEETSAQEMKKPSKGIPFSGKYVHVTLSFSHLSMKIIYLLELQRRMLILDKELKTINSFLSTVIQKYRDNKISRVKASYLASWTHMQKKILLKVKKITKEKFISLFYELSTEERYLLIFELKDLLKRIRLMSNTSKRLRQRILKYEKILGSRQWTELTRDLPFEELIGKEQGVNVEVRDASSVKAFQGVLMANSQEDLPLIPSVATSLMGKNGKKVETTQITSITQEWEEQMADELISTFIGEEELDESEKTDIEKEVDIRANIEIEPIMVTKDLDREIREILDEIKHVEVLLTHSSDIGQGHPPPNYPPVQNVFPPLPDELESPPAGEQETMETDETSKSGDVSPSLDETDTETLADDSVILYGASSLLGSSGAEDLDLLRQDLLAAVDNLKNLFDRKQIKIIFPHGLRTGGEIFKFIWINGEWHAIVRLLDAPHEWLLLKVLRNEKIDLDKDRINLKKVARERIARRLDVPLENAFDADILWRYSSETYLGLLPWEVTTSRIAFVPLKLIEKTPASGVISLANKDDISWWILQHGRLLSTTGGFLGYIRGFKFVIDSNGSSASLSLLKARNDIRDVLRVLRGGLTVSDMYLYQFNQRVARMWGLPGEEAMLPINQARYLLYFFYSGDRKDLSSCERWLYGKFDVAEQSMLGFKSASAHRTLILLT